MSKKSGDNALGTDFSSLLDEKDQDELVRQQLLEVAESTRNRPESAAPTPESEPAVVSEPVVAPEEMTTPESEPAGRPDPETSMVEIDDVPMIEIFLHETGDHLDNIEEKIVRLEETSDAALVDEIFRSMHTIKGTSSFFGFRMVTQVSHETESLLDDLRAGKFQMSPAIADLLLAAADHLQHMVDGISAACAAHDQSKVPFFIEEPVRDIGKFMDRISTVRNAAAGGNPVVSGKTAAPVAQPVPEAGVAPAGVREDLVSQEMIDTFRDESEELLSQAEVRLLELENNPSKMELVDDTFRCVHTIKGNAGFLGYAHIETVCMSLEDILELLRKGERPVDQKTTTTLLGTIDSLRDTIHRSVSGEGTVGAPAAGGGTELDAVDPYQPLGELLVSLGLVTEEAVGTALEQQERKLGEILVSSGAITEEKLNQALSTQEKAAEAAKGRADVAERKDVRVDVGKLDRLFDLMGELITAEAMVVQNPDLHDLELERFQRSANYLGKITRQMQEITMSVRMIPLDGMFNKLRRVVRDLSRKMAKPIALVDSGRDTEMDRNVIEALSDPLVHIMRNAVDHGIETAEEREKAGKPAEGRLHLSARYEGSEIWISCRDDGRGLDRESIIERAISRGLVSEANAANLSERQVWQFLFEPGFSTAKTVSDVSGRGVGMDVVKRNIEQLKGKVDVLTTPGEGTEVILKIPLTLAIVDGVTTRVGKMLYSIPLSEIREFHRLREDAISPMASGPDMLSLRNQLIPVVRLREFFGISGNDEGRQRAILIIVQSGTDRVALLVDEIVGYHQIVVKSLPEYMGDVRGLSGCSVLGNGEVSFIIDAGSLASGQAV